MMSCSVLHHVEICVKEETKLITKLTKGFGFRPFACRITPQACRWALRSGHSVFIITRRNNEAINENCLSKWARNEDRGDKTHESSQITNDESCKINNKGLDIPSTESSKGTDKGSDIAYTKSSKSTPCNGKNCNIIHEENASLCQKLCTKTESAVCTGSSPGQLEREQTELEHWTVFCCWKEGRHNIDSVFNVALVVKDVDEVTRRVRSRGGTVLREPSDIKDRFGKVRYAIVTSCCGNVVHTLIDKRHYRGDFLPGYEEYAGNLNGSVGGIECHVDIAKKMENKIEHIVSPSKSDFKTSPQGSGLSNGVAEHIIPIHNPDKSWITVNNEDLWPEEAPISTFMDHITYVCNEGTSKDVIDWYEHCLGMKRFKTNRDDSEEDGFVVGGNVGIRLKALEYWRCAEVGLIANSSDAGDCSFKLVLGEALPGVDQSQVNHFLKAHGGPGVQHIGLHTSTMVATVHYMAQRGVEFCQPPPVYYQEGIKLEEIQEAGHGSEVEKFQELGILLDTEADVFTDVQDPNDSKRYLMQVFTTPIFAKDTFFLEVIQRCGARGFGAGNITALAKSIILYKQQLERGTILAD